MRSDTGTKEWTRVDYFTCICMRGIHVATVIYGYVTDFAGYLCINAFAMASATTACGQSTVTLSYKGACR